MVALAHNFRAKARHRGNALICYLHEPALRETARRIVPPSDIASRNRT
jgi:hypothetical protein